MAWHYVKIIMIIVVVDATSATKLATKAKGHVADQFCQGKLGLIAVWLTVYLDLKPINSDWQ